MSVPAAGFQGGPRGYQPLETELYYPSQNRGVWPGGGRDGYREHTASESEHPEYQYGAHDDYRDEMQAPTVTSFGMHMMQPPHHDLHSLNLNRDARPSSADSRYADERSSDDSRYLQAPCDSIQHASRDYPRAMQLPVQSAQNPAGYGMSIQQAQHP